MIKQFRILVSGKSSHESDWSNCSDWTIEEIECLVKTLNKCYKNKWQMEFRDLEKK